VGSERHEVHIGVTPPRPASVPLNRTPAQVTHEVLSPTTVRLMGFDVAQRGRRALTLCLKCSIGAVAASTPWAHKTLIAIGFSLPSSHPRTCWRLRRQRCPSWQVHWECGEMALYFLSTPLCQELSVESDPHTRLLISDDTPLDCQLLKDALMRARSRSAFAETRSRRHPDKTFQLIPAGNFLQSPTQKRCASRKFPPPCH
jgi:hypothetical protein